MEGPASQQKAGRGDAEERKEEEETMGMCLRCRCIADGSVLLLSVRSVFCSPRCCRHAEPSGFAGPSGSSGFGQQQCRQCGAALRVAPCRRFIVARIQQSAGAWVGAFRRRRRSSLGAASATDARTILFGECARRIQRGTKDVHADEYGQWEGQGGWRKLFVTTRCVWYPAGAL
jgi:hypothetical protein